jgi:hypothetical protein
LDADHPSQGVLFPRRITIICEVEGTALDHAWRTPCSGISPGQSHLALWRLNQHLCEEVIIPARPPELALDGVFCPLHLAGVDSPARRGSARFCGPWPFWLPSSGPVGGDLGDRGRADAEGCLGIAGGCHLRRVSYEADQPAAQRPPDAGRQAGVASLVDPPCGSTPLHTNGSENEIRCQVIRRKVNVGTRSEAGRDCRDAFLGLAQSCAKHAIAFRDYLGSRLNVARQPLIPCLPDLIRCPGPTPEQHAALAFAPLTS